MITRWPSQITATRRDKIDDFRVSGQPRLNGKLRGENMHLRMKLGCHPARPRTEPSSKPGLRWRGASSRTPWPYRG
jgi:hypothetical protein